MNIRTRLGKLETHPKKLRHDSLNVIIHRFVDPENVSSELTHLYSDCETYHYFREQSEAENAFKTRAIESVRKYQNKAPSAVLVLFGDTDSKLEGNHV